MLPKLIDIPPPIAARALSKLIDKRRRRTQTKPQDDAVDRLHREVFTALLSQDNPYTIETAIDVTLLSRYERFADHAVSVAQRLVFLVTGEDERH